eukprot:gene17961-12872_t
MVVSGTNYELIQLRSFIVGNSAGERSGASVALSSSLPRRLIVGSPYYSNGTSTTGKATVYEESTTDPTGWKSIYVLTGPSGNGMCGYSVTINSGGTRFAVGCPFDQSDNGRVYVGVYTNGNLEISQLLGTNTNGYFGVSVSFLNTYLAVGEYGASVNDVASAGQVYIYTGSYIQPSATISGTTANEMLGYRVAMASELVVAVVSLGYSSPLIDRAGKVTIHNILLGVAAATRVLYGEETDEFTSSSLAITSDGQTLAVGTAKSDVGSLVDAGRVRVYSYSYSSGTWSQKGYQINGTQSNELCGSSVSLDSTGKSLVMGCPQYSSANKGRA